MTIPELVACLCARHLIKPSRQKDLTTSVKYLAAAYQTTPDGLDLATIEGSYQDTLRAYFARLRPVKSAHVVRNTVDNIRHLFRQAHTAHLLRPAPLPPKKDGRSRGVMKAWALSQKTSPYRATNPMNLRRYFVPPAQWPADIRQRWSAYTTSIHAQVRATTLYTYERNFTQYLSFCLNPSDQETGQPLHGEPAITGWDDLFDPERLQRFTTWHTARVQAPGRTRTAWEAAKLITTMALRTHHPAYDALKQWLDQSKARPAPMHNKRSRLHTFSTAELERVALEMLEESRQPFCRDYARYHLDRPKHPGMRRALLHQLSLILRLLWRTGLRQRNIREMEWEKNLYQDDHGHWRLLFVGTQLKVAERRGEVNVYDPPFPYDLVPHLEEFREQFRPHLMNAETDPHVFLTFWGKPYTQKGLRTQLAAHVYLRTGKRFYPHLTRSIWADEWMHQGGDPDTVAAVLNDTLQTVLTHYRKLKTQDLFMRAHQYNARVTERDASPNGHGPAIATEPPARDRGSSRRGGPWSPRHAPAHGRPSHSEKGRFPRI